MQIQAFYPESSTHEKNCEKGVQSEDSLDNEKWVSLSHKDLH